MYFQLHMSSLLELNKQKILSLSTHIYVILPLK